MNSSGSKLPALLLACLAACLTPPARGASPGSGWTMIFNDEFATPDPRNAQGIDPDKWSWGSLPWGGIHHNTQYASYITPEDSYVSDGSLRLRCRKISRVVNGTTIPWTEGFVHSNGKFRHVYGYVEIRARFMNHAGTWPAFWSLSDGWPPEFDIAEPFGSDYRVHHGLATGADWQSVSWNSYNGSAEGIWDWNTWGLEWAPGVARFYKNGNVVYEVKGNQIPQREMYYILNSGMRWTYNSGTPDGHVHEIDYIRVYQRSEHLANSGFEAYENYGGWIAQPWSHEGFAVPTNTAGDFANGSAAFRLTGETGARAVTQQTARSLLPNTPYIFTGLAKSSTGNPFVKLGVYNHGAPHTFALQQSPGFSRFIHPFQTGSAATSATLYAQVDAGAGTGFVDDLDIRRSGVVNDSGFERRATDKWWTYGDVSTPATTERRSGDAMLRFEKSATAKGAEQTVFDLTPATTYRLSTWIRTHDEELRLGVKDHGNPETFLAQRGLNWLWTRVTHDFTTGPSATSATIYGWTPSTPNNPLYIDDFFLTRTFPLPWIAGDIGSGGVGGESGIVADGRFALRGSGANIFGTSDTFHMVHRELRGNGSITARLATFEARDPAAKAGVMIRASADPGAAHMMVHWLPSGQVERISRPSNNSISTYLWAPAPSPDPPHLRLLRSGNTITAEYSTDGTNWLPVGSPLTIDLPPVARAGLAVTSHNAGDMGEAIFSAVSISAPDADLDALPDSWETEHFGNTASSGTDDFDNDGTHNLAEFLLGLDPANGASSFRASIQPAGNAFTLTWPSASGLSFRIERSTTLGGTWNNLVTVQGGTFTDSNPPANRAFYRVVLLPP